MLLRKQLILRAPCLRLLRQGIERVVLRECVVDAGAHAGEAAGGGDEREQRVCGGVVGREQRIQRGACALECIQQLAAAELIGGKGPALPRAERDGGEDTDRRSGKKYDIIKQPRLQEKTGGQRKK